VTDFIGLEGERIDLLISLLVGFRLASFGAAEDAPSTAKSGADQRARARGAETPSITRIAGSTGDRTGGGADGTSPDTADRAALHRSFEFLGIACLAGGLARR
jgi:hypothetical protein